MNLTEHIRNRIEETMHEKYDIKYVDCIDENKQIVQFNSGERFEIVVKQLNDYGKDAIQSDWIKVNSKDGIRNILLNMKFPCHTIESILDYLENTNRHVTLTYSQGMMGVSLHEVILKQGKNGEYYYKNIY